MTYYTWKPYDNIPSSWEPVLERLKKFESLTQQINKAQKEQGSASNETLKTFYRQHDALMSEVHARLQHAPIHCDKTTLDSAFIEAVWLSLEHYPALVHHSEIENLDTAGSKNLHTLYARCPDEPR